MHQAPGHWEQTPALRAHWRDLGLHGTCNLGVAFEQAALTWPMAELVIDGTQGQINTTLHALHQQGLQVACALASLGLREGDVLAVQLPNCVEGVLLQRAAAALGVIFLPVVPIYGPSELGQILRDACARMLIAQSSMCHSNLAILVQDMRALPRLDIVVALGEPVAGFRSWSELLNTPNTGIPINHCGPNDVALLVYTSGTTGFAKGVQHSANSLLAENRSVVQRRIDPDTPQLSPWPPGHIASVVTGLEYSLRGRPTVLMEKWDARRAASLIERHRIVASSGTPFHLAALLDAADREGADISSLKDYLTGAASVPSSLVQQCAARGIHTYRAYGLSEHPTVTLGSSTDALESRLHTEGCLTLGNEIRLVDEKGSDVSSGTDGEIVVRGPEGFIGYRDPSLNVAAFLPGGWFLTGDIGHLDKDGFLRLTDRKKDIINRGGEKIASREVENAVLQLPGISDVAVVGMPDERLGERVCAFVICTTGTTPTLEQLSGHFKKLGLARQKTPEHLILVDALPRNASGKVLKQLLRARFTIA